MNVRKQAQLAGGSGDGLGKYTLIWGGGIVRNSDFFREGPVDDHNIMSGGKLSSSETSTRTRIIMVIPRTVALSPVSRTDQLLIDLCRNQWREIPPFYQDFPHDGKNTRDF